MEDDLMCCLKGLQRSNRPTTNGRARNCPRAQLTDYEVFKMEPAVRVELTTNGLQIRCSATELRWLNGTANYANNGSKVNPTIREFAFRPFSTSRPSIYRLILLSATTANGTTSASFHLK
jgi:hypothetical protein